ncbi:MAG TPA: hypothetical protein VFG49_14950 [Dyella sp.]|uniref:hypothetical protein n=1 Tax=Dyella sp. TaxID=1869338 RepID=UPI002D773625|nr:hypothetical protein [Dyella sp.]HET6554822.1 hypothetical protein [Dyella sp.]
MKALPATWLLIPGAAGPSAPTQYLIDSAAADFHAHSTPAPVQFRHVRLGHVSAADGAKQYFLCGEYAPASSAGKAAWTPFITIKTSGYENWLGDQAKSYCERPSIEWDDAGELSSVLQQRFDAGPLAK